MLSSCSYIQEIRNVYFGQTFQIFLEIKTLYMKRIYMVNITPFLENFISCSHMVTINLS